jgi:hypothetical protein
MTMQYHWQELDKAYYREALEERNEARAECEQLRAINAKLVDALDMLEMESSNALGVGDGRPLPFGLLDRPLGRAIAKARETLAASKKGQPATD